MIIGVDPGLSGAVAVVDHAGTFVAVHDTPTLTLRTSRGSRSEYDVVGMASLLRPYVDQHVHVVIEEATSRPGQGVRSMFTCGLGMGVWLGIVGALGLAHTRVRPHVWKRSLGLGSDKEACRFKAIQWYPDAHADLRLKRHHGRAEALLLAYYGLRSGLLVPPGART